MWVCSQVFKERVCLGKANTLSDWQCIVQRSTGQGSALERDVKMVPPGRGRLNQGMEPKGLEESQMILRGSWENGEALI